MTLIHSPMEGIILDAENRNGMTYPSQLTMRVFQEALSRPLYIVFDEPTSISIAVELRSICGVVERIERADTSLIIDWKVLDTPMGGVVGELLAAKVPLLVLPHGLALVDLNGLVLHYIPISLYIKSAASIPSRGA